LVSLCAALASRRVCEEAGRCGVLGTSCQG